MMIYSSKSYFKGHIEALKALLLYVIAKVMVPVSFAVKSFFDISCSVQGNYQLDLSHLWLWGCSVDKNAFIWQAKKHKSLCLCGCGALCLFEQHSTRQNIVLFYHNKYLGELEVFITKLLLKKPSWPRRLSVLNILWLMKLLGNMCIDLFPEKGILD